MGRRGLCGGEGLAAGGWAPSREIEEAAARAGGGGELEKADSSRSRQ
jgi:hypothetical protein